MELPPLKLQKMCMLVEKRPFQGCLPLPGASQVRFEATRPSEPANPKLKEGAKVSPAHGVGLAPSVLACFSGGGDPGAMFVASSGPRRSHVAVFEVYLSKKIAIPHQLALQAGIRQRDSWCSEVVSWNSAQGWIACGGLRFAAFACDSEGESGLLKAPEKGFFASSRRS